MTPIRPLRLPATPLACTVLLLSACGGGGDDIADAGTSAPGDAARAQALASPPPAAGTLVLASANAAGAARGGSLCALSADGRQVLFSSDSSRVTAGDTNNASDVFLKDLRSGAVTRVSTGSGGAQLPAGSACLGMTPDARAVLLAHDGAVFVKNVVSGTLTQATPPPASIPQNQGFGAAAISDDGSKVVFVTVPTQRYVGTYQFVNNVPARLMVRDLASGSLTTVPTDDGNVANGEVVTGGVSFSPDSRQLAFVSSSDNLVPGDGNRQDDVFVRDLVSGATLLASSDSRGAPAVPTVCCNFFYHDLRFVADGRLQFLAAQPSSLGERGDYLKDLRSGALRQLLVSGEGDGASVSASANRVAFTRSYAGFSHRVFVRDLLTGQEQLASSSSTGVPSNGGTSRAMLSRDGGSVAFNADSSNLVSPRPPAGSSQVYVKTLAVPVTTAP